MLIVDTSSGTVLTAEHCVILSEDDLTESEWEELDTMSDSEVSDLARQRGHSVMTDVQALDAVAELLSAEQWSSDHINAVAEMIMSTGRIVLDV